MAERKPINKCLRGLYVITDPELCQSNILNQVEEAISGGAQISQYRNKRAPIKQKQQEAESLNALCKKHQRLFIVNDDVELAKTVDADGVHLGQSDTPLSEARHLLGKDNMQPKPASNY